MRIVREGELSLTVELGDLTVVILSDGEIAMPLDSLIGPDGAVLGAEDLADVTRLGDGLWLPVRAFLVKGPEGCLMIDAGGGGAWPKGLGLLPLALAEAQVGPQEVTGVALTHSHSDHFSGLVDADGALAFPNAARVFLAIEDMRDFRARPRMGPVMPRLVPLEQGDGPMRGVTVIAAPGHTPGHVAFLVEGRMLIWGDLVHHAPLQFARPEVASVNDSDPDQARATRLALMEQAVGAGWLVAGAHLPDPGIGWIERQGTGFAFRPVGGAAASFI
jgi:glyoxylase-like metal-dependent hydrolase (beta-lactamase superfamily II)